MFNHLILLADLNEKQNAIKALYAKSLLAKKRIHVRLFVCLFGISARSLFAYEDVGTSNCMFIKTEQAYSNGMIKLPCF